MADKDRLEATKKQLEAYLGRTLEPSGKLNELLDILSRFNYLPQLITTEPLYGATGEYSPVYRQLRLAPSSGKDESTASHEYVHALDALMMFKAQDWNKPRSQQFLWGLFNQQPTEAQKQFAEAYQKLQPSTTKLPNKPSPKEYRGSNPEMRAWGVSEQVKKGVNPASQHIDPTMASEFDILVDLFKRTGLEPTIK